MYYDSVPGKCPRALKHNSWVWPAWTLTQNITSIICLYRSSYIDPLKCTTWALALSRDRDYGIMHKLLHVQFPCTIIKVFSPVLIRIELNEESSCIRWLLLVPYTQCIHHGSNSGIMLEALLRSTHNWLYGYRDIDIVWIHEPAQRSS